MNIEKSLKIILIIFIVSLVLLVPKIYIRNKIYYISKELNRGYVFYFSLQEENKYLKQQLEDMKFKNQIMDSIILSDIIIDNEQID